MIGRHRWWWRAAGGVVAFCAVEGLTLLIHGEADELRLAAVVTLVVCAVALLIDASPVEPAVWTVPAEAEPGLARLDPRTASYLRILEGHVSAREADVALRNRLRDLTDQTLRARHDLGLDDPRATALLGADLVRVLREPPTKLDPRQIDTLVTRIEEL